jgi:hypothetical protein
MNAHCSYKNGRNCPPFYRRFPALSLSMELEHSLGWAPASQECNRIRWLHRDSGANINLLVFLLIVTCMLVSGCQIHPHLQLSEVKLPSEDGVYRQYDSTGDGQPDFFTFADSSGRISRIGYDNDVDAAPDIVVNLDELPAARCRHLVLILDGFGYDLLKRCYDSGKLRMFHPPSRVVSPYPSVTEVSLSAILGSSPPRAVQTRYFDRKTNSMVGGVMDYIKGRNEPFSAVLTYRAPQHVDGLGYLLGMPMFNSELNTVKRLFDKRASREVIAYFVTSSAVSVRDGVAGQMECLYQLDRFVTEVLWQSRGLVKITMLADHGLSHDKVEQLDLEKHLTDRGWLLKDRIDGPRDVVFSALGVVTYACLSTRRPCALSEHLITCEGVDLVSYARKDAVEVLTSDGGRAVVRAQNGRFIYEPRVGDPLSLTQILDLLDADEHGSYDSDDLLRATATHVYPAPLQRLWEAHFLRVENPPDVIVSLEDHYCYGPSSFSGMVHFTHGSLNNRNSVTFLMSTAGRFTPIIRSCDIRKQIGGLLDSSWPMRE